MAPVDSGELQAVPANDLGRRSGSRSRRIGVVPEPKMSVSRSVAEVLADHVTLEVEGIDRMYLNVYIPGLQREQGVACFFRFHRGHQFASSALMDPISKTFVAALEAFARQEKIPVITFRKGQRKDDVAAEQRRKFQKPEGVVFIGKAQEKTPVFRTERRRSETTGGTYPWLVRSTAMVNHFYIYCVDRDFGPFFLKFSTYFPYNAKLCLNGHEYAKQQLAHKGIRVRGSRQWSSVLRQPQTATEHLRWTQRGEDRRFVAEMATVAASPLQHERPQGWLPVPDLDPAGGVLPDPGARPTRDRPGVLRRGDP